MIMVGASDRCSGPSLAAGVMASNGVADRAILSRLPAAVGSPAS